MEKTEVNEVDEDSNILISDIAFVNEKYKLKNLFEKKYSFVLYFKYKNIFSWIYVTFIKLNTIILIILNLFLNMQTIGLKEYYVNILNNQYTIEKCYKDLQNYILNTIFIGGLCYLIIMLIGLISKKKYITNLKILYLILLSTVINLNMSFRFLKSKFKPYKSKTLKVETKEDNIHFINVCSTAIGSFCMNELIQTENGNQFLKISGLLSISTFVYDVIMIFINIDVDKNIKTFIIIQIFQIF